MSNVSRHRHRHLAAQAKEIAVHLEGSCHCGKVKFTVESAEPVPFMRRYFCSQCGSALWVWAPTWPELVHPHASAIDTPLPMPPESVHCLVASRASWVKVEGGPGDLRFEHYPNMSLAQWHLDKGLSSPVEPARSQR